VEVTSDAVFISYRRDVGWQLAQLLYQQLVAEPDPHDVFYDLESLAHAGSFDVRLLDQIRARPYFVLVLVPGTLERCIDPGDWLRREIDHAVATQRTVVPVFGPEFDVADVRTHLPAGAADRILGSQGVRVYHEYFSEAMSALRALLVPVRSDVVPLTEEDLEHEREVRRLVETQDPVDVDDVLGGGTPPAVPWWRRLVGHTATRAAIGLLVVSGVVAGGLGARSCGGDGTGGTTSVVASGELRSGDELRRGETVRSADGRQRLTMTTAGELQAVASDGTVWWRQPTVREPGERLEVQRDGNLVVYTDDDDGVWATGTSGRGAVVLTIASDGDRGAVRLHDDDGQLLWETAQGAPGQRSMLRAEDRLRRGQRLTSTDGRHVLELTSTGVLQASTAGRVWWREGTPDRPGEVLVMQDDGNLVLYGESDAVWDAGTSSIDDGDAFTLIEDRDGAGRVVVADSSSAARYVRADVSSAGASPSTEP
jgi:hypothetical protein